MANKRKEERTMNFDVKRELKNGIFFVSIEYSGYGDESMTAESEADVFKKLGHPRIQAGGVFEGTFKLNSETGVVVNDESGSMVRTIMDNKKIVVDESFKADYFINVDRILDSEICPNLPTKEYVAEARCLLVEQEILKRIEDKVIEIKSKMTSFDEGYPKKTII